MLQAADFDRQATFDLAAEAPMKRFVVYGLIICLGGCTTMRPVAGNPSELQQRIASGELIRRGDRVALLTKDGATHEFKVTSLSASTIDGKLESIPVDQVAAVQKRELNVGKTVLIVGLTVVGAASIIVVVDGIRTAAGLAILGSSH
jgi:hypothetical protein